MALYYMRRHRRWLLISLWLVILAFIILYIPALRDVQEGGQSEVIGRVGGQPITRGEYTQVYFNQRRMLEQMNRERLNRDQLRRLPDYIFQVLVEKRLLALEARRLGVEIDEGTIARAIMTDPSFQIDGRFNSTEYRKRLELLDQSVAEYEASVRDRLLEDRVRALLTAGVTVSAADIEQEYRRRNERVRLEYVLADAEAHRAQIKVADDEIARWFKEHQETYRVAEKRVVDYVILDREKLESQVAVTEKDIEQYFEQNEDDFEVEELVCARHILVKMASEQEETGRSEGEARKIAADLLSKLRAGADFTQLARKSSEDPGSASNGGDLGCFPRGSMVREFANEAFRLDPGQISELVRTQYGFHIIQSLSHKGGEIPQLAAVKDRIRRLLVDQRVDELMDQKLSQASAQLSRTRKLAEVARVVGVEIAKSPALARGETPAPLVSRELNARAFELSVSEAATEPFAIPQGWAFIALAEIQPSRIPALTEIHNGARGDLARERAFERALALAQDVKKRAEKDGLGKAAAQLKLKRQETPQELARGQSLGDLGSSYALEKAAFSLEPGALSAPVRVASGYAVLRVLSKTAFDKDAFAKQQAAIEEALRGQRQRQFYQSFMDQSRRFHAVERTGAYRNVTSID